MWHCPEKYKTKIPDINKELSELKGYLDDEEAKISLAKFLRANLGITTELISGIKLAPYQEITLKGMMNRNFSMCVWGRGCGKTFIASVFCFLSYLLQFLLPVFLLLLLKAFFLPLGWRPLIA